MAVLPRTAAVGIPCQGTHSPRAAKAVLMWVSAGRGTTLGSIPGAGQQGPPMGLERKGSSRGELRPWVCGKRGCLQHHALEKGFARTQT